ncbi:MAG: hypothetical protein LBR79_03625 [Oscillospiraceae bacterium]|nr:hypothetical protein [Oscillospiraceae bacterium]
MIISPPRHRAGGEEVSTILRHDLRKSKFVRTVFPPPLVGREWQKTRLFSRALAL